MFSQDTHLYPVIIEAGSTSLALSEGGGAPVTVTLLTGTWYAYKSTGTTPAGLSPYSSLYDMIEARIALAGLDGDYELQQATPTGATGAWAEDTGIALVDLLGGDFEIRWDLSTVDPRIFGFPSTQSVTVPSVLSAVTGSCTKLGAYTPKLPPVSKTSFDVRDLYVSTEDVQRLDAYQMDYGSRVLRTFSYEIVPGGLVFRSRNQFTDYALGSGLQVGDQNNCLQLLQERGRLLEPLLYFPNLKVFEVSDSVIWQSYKLSSADQRASLEAMISLRSMGGEYYDLNWSAIITGGNDDY